jgi:ribonuclease HII
MMRDMSSLRIAGVDEAGRGPVIGPLIIAGIVIKEEHSDALVEWGIRDSKHLTRRKREVLELTIRRIALQVKVIEISAAEIDTQRSAKRSLNDLEAEWMAVILQHLQWDVAYVDAADVIAERYGRTIQTRLKTEKAIVSEHKADQNYPVVAAASILAKVRRDQRISELHRQYGDFGSGYPSDPLTRRFLREWIAKHGTFPEIVRHSWETTRKILAVHKQQTLP